MSKTYLRGEMYFADLGQGIGSEQNGRRPVIIIQNDVGNKHSPTVIVAALTSEIKGKAKLPTHYFLKAGNGLVRDSVVLLEQLRTIDKRRLEEYIGKVSDKHIAGINHALAISIGLIDPVPQKLILCLCSTCANNFYGTGAFTLKRVNPNATEKDRCTYCGQRIGFDYEIRPKGRGGGK